jgi:8-oxo-dGTP pyrophosphatase MutT (NUDIX family)
LPNPAPKRIRAAGGIVRGPHPHADRIVVVHRRRYPGDVSLPKGKARRGESDEDAAVREVREETGYDVRIVRFAGTTEYVVKNASKVVTYFLMQATSAAQVARPDPGEIEGLTLMTPQEAAAALTHRQDRDLIAAVFAL